MGATLSSRQPTTCMHALRLLPLTYGHTYVWAQTPPGHRCSPKIFRGLIPSLCKVFQFQNKQHSWPNKFNVIKSAKFKVGAQNAYLNVHKFYFYNAALKILQGLSIHILMSIYLHYLLQSWDKEAINRL